MAKVTDIQAILAPPGTVSLARREEYNKILSNLGMFETSGQYDFLSNMGEQDIERLGFESAKNFLMPEIEAGTKTNEDLFQLAKIKSEDLRVVKSQKLKEGQKKLLEAGERGAFLTPMSASSTKEQKQAQALKMPWKETTFQVHEGMIKDGIPSPEEIAKFGSTHPDRILDAEGISDKTKQVFKGRLDQERVGPKKFDDPSPEGRGWAAETALDTGMFALKVLGTTGEFSNGYLAGFHEAINESKIADELRARGGSTVAGTPSELMRVPFMTGSFYADLATDPEMTGRILLEQTVTGLSSLEEGLRSAAGVWTDMGPVKGIAKTLGKTRVAYMKQAFEMAKEDLGATQSSEELNARTNAIFKELVKNDSAAFAMEWPRTTEALITAVTDPLNVVGGALFKYAGKTIKGAWETGKKIPGLKQLLEGSEEAAKFATAPARQLLIRGPYDTKTGIEEGSRLLKASGKHGKSMRLAIMAAQDAGQGARRELTDVGHSIDGILSRIKKDEVESFWEIVEAWGDTGRSSARLDIEIADRISDPKKQAQMKKIIEDYLPQADKFYEISARNGQLNDIRKATTEVDGESVVGHAVIQASKVEGYLPYRHFEGIGDLKKRVNSTGFVDVESAIAALKKNNAESKLAKLSPDTEEYKAMEETVSQLDDILVARKGNTVDMKELLADKNKDLRSALYSISKSRNQVDLMGQSKLHRTSAVSGAAKERYGNLPPIKDARLQWKTHIAKEVAKAEKSAQIKELAEFAGVKEIQSSFRGESLGEHLSGGGLIKTIQLTEEGGKKLKHDKNVVAAAVQSMGDELGHEMAQIDPKFAEKIFQVIGTPFDPRKTVMVMPKSMALRMEEILPKMHIGRGDKYEKIASLYDDFSREFLKPVNDLFRTSRTVTRSLAFHSTNHVGAIGIGALALGARAANPMLQKEAVMLAYKSNLADVIAPAFFPSVGAAAGGVVGYQQGEGDLADVAMGAAAGLFVGKGLQMSRTKVGSKYNASNLKVKVGPNKNDQITMAEAQEILSKYNITSQGALRYGGAPADLAPGPSSWNLPGRAIAGLAKVQHQVAAKTRLQQVAQMGDDYQKAVTFLGYLRKNGKVSNGKLSLDSIHKAVDFTSEWAGNYSRLTQFEKRFMRDQFGFYSWNRFILPAIAKHMYKNPQRLAAFEKIRRGMESYVYDTTGGVVPTAGVPDWMRLSGATMAPQMFQPQSEPGEPAPHHVAMGILETPNAALSSFAPGFSGESPIAAQFGPIGLSLSYAISGFNEGVLPKGRGGQISGFMPHLDEVVDSFDSPEAMSSALFTGDDSLFFREAKNSVPFGAALMDLSKLYLRNNMIDEAAEVPLRYKAGRDWLGLENALARSLGLQPMSIANWMPGYRIYALDPLRVAARRKARARAYLPDKPLE